MSLMMMALRISAVEALKAANTLVGDNVLDSQISAIDLTADGGLKSDQQRPFIAVYTDTAKAGDIGHSGLRTNGRVEVLFNCGVSMTMAQSNKATGEDIIIEGFPATDAHFEAILDVLDAQIGRALSDPENAWAQVFGDFVTGYVAKEHLRSSSSGDNVRLAAAQTKLTVEVFADPALGQQMAETGPWPRFMALMEAGGLPQLDIMQTMLGEADPAALYDAYERLTGMTVHDAAALQLYTHGGVARDVTVTEPVSEHDPDG